MIDEFVKVWFEHKDELEREFRYRRPRGYADIVGGLVGLLNRHLDGYEKPDTDRIHQIDDGDYQGTLVFVIGATGYQPSRYWATRVSYGSCSGCDTLQAIQGWNETPDEDEVAGTMTLALHLLQQLKPLWPEGWEYGKVESPAQRDEG